MKCRVYVCSREAAPGSEFCRVKHGWWEPTPEPVLAPILRLPIADPIVRDCVGCAQPFEQARRPAKLFSYCESCRGIAA